jgi:tripartite ATP-independent transporter DctM subunit
MEQKKHTIFSILGIVEKAACIAALVFIVVIAVAEVVSRVLGTSVPSAGVLLSHFLLFVGLIAGMYTSKTGEHLSISLFQFVKDEKTRKIFSIITGLFAVFICSLLAWSSVSFIKIGMQSRMVGFIPNMFFVIAMPLAFTVMALRFGMHLPAKVRAFFPLAMILGTAAAFPALVKIIWGFDWPDSIYTLIDTFYIVLFYIRLPLILLLIGIALIGAPIFTVLAGVTLVMIQSAGGEPEVVNSLVFAAITDTNIIVIPLFTLTGFFLSESRAGHRLVYAFRSLFSWVPGGLIIATVIICAFFTSFTGASGVTILAIGGILYTILSEKSIYPERFSIGLLTSAGCIGLLFPPSLPIILVGATMRTNIIHMFMGSLIPGVILIIAMVVIGIVMSLKLKVPVERFNFRSAVSSVKGSILEIILPIFLIGGYFSGLFTLVEIGAISVLYVFIAEVLIHREIKFADIPKVFYKALPIIGGILCIIAMANALSYAIVDTQAPENLARWVKGAIDSRILFLLLLNLSLLALGCVMDIFSAILVVLPLIAPLGAAYGIDPVHLGVIFLINMEVGFLTPPVGINLMLSSYRFGKPFMQVCRYVAPFLIVQLIVVFLVTYIPILSTFLPRFF